MQLIITIDMDNAAFEPEYQCEVVRILRKYANALERDEWAGDSDRPLFDINGNRVGEAVLSDG